MLLIGSRQKKFKGATQAAIFAMTALAFSQVSLAQKAGVTRNPSEVPNILKIFAQPRPSQIDFDSKLLTPEMIQKVRNGETCRGVQKDGETTSKMVAKFIELYFETSDGKIQFLWAKYQKDKLIKGEKLYEEIAETNNVLQIMYLKRVIKHLENEYSIFGTTTDKASETIFIGDSLMEYFSEYQRHMTTSKPAWLEKSYNAGIAGDYVEAMAARAPLNIALHNPKNIVISIGGNNILRGCMLDPNWNNAAEGTLEKFKQLIQNIKQVLPTTNIYVFTLPPTGFKFTKDSILNYNQRLREMSQDLGFTVLDQYRYLADFNNNKFDHYFNSPSDPIHISEMAYQLIWMSLMNLYFDFIPAATP